MIIIKKKDIVIILSISIIISIISQISIYYLIQNKIIFLSI